MTLKNACVALWLLLWASMACAQVVGSGTNNTIPVWTGPRTLGNSQIFQFDGNVGIGTRKPDARLDVVTTSTTEPAITGSANATSGFAAGVTGQSASVTGIGVNGSATATTGDAYGVFGQTATTGFGAGVIGTTTANTGNAYGVFGQSSGTSGNGVFGYASAPSGFTIGVVGFVESPTGTAGRFVANAGSGLLLQGVSGNSGTNVVFTVDANGNGFLAGNLDISGTISKGSGSFKIDHPLDPANKYLSHSFVESPDMMNIYNGVVTLNLKGEALVHLPEYFQALNSDFRYQLTAIGAPGPNLYIAKEISGNHFKVAGGKPGGKVSWQVTGVRQDAFARAHRIEVEEDKPAQQRGHYLHPELFGPTEKEAVGASAPATRLPVTTAERNRANLR
jgi:trimeric autotransporter adhesin